MKYKIYISPEDRASNVYASSALWNGHTTNEKEQMGRCADYMERGLLRCGSFEVINAQYGNMYDRVKESNNWPSDMHVAPHTNGFNGKAAGTRVHCYPSDRSRRIGKLIQDRIAPLSTGAPDKLVESTNLYELRATHMAAVLPEFGFHDNPEDAQWLVDNMAKRVLSVALSHARKYRYIETNAAKDTLTKFGKSDKTPDPYTPEQVKDLMQRVEGTIWEMPVILGGLYGMRRSEILGLRWRNVDLENNTFDVTEQLPFKVPPKTKVIEEMAPPKSNGRKLPITELARPFFLKQLAMQEVQKEQAAKDGKPYYDNDLVVAKPDGAPIAASWVSSQFGKLLEDLDMPHIRFHDLRHTAATNMHQLTGDFYTVGEVLGHTLAGIGASLGLSMNFEAVTARYVDVRLERKKEVLDAYHSAVEKAAPEKPKEAEPKKGKRASKKKHSEIDL